MTTNAALLASLTSAADDLAAVQIAETDPTTTAHAAADLALLTEARRELQAGEAYPLSLPRAVRMMRRCGWL